MRIFDPLIDQEADVLLVRAQCLENLKNGVIFTSFSNENLNAGMQVSIKTKDLFNATTIFLKELHPEIYGKVVSKTRPFFTY